MNKILKYKLEHDVSYREMSRRFGLDSAILCKYATGKLDVKNMTLETAARICKGMGIENPLELLENDQE